MKKIKDKKASEGNRIPEEAWKYEGEAIKEWVWKICGRIWKRDGWIEEWNKGIIVLVLKKGEKDRVENYKEVTLTDTLYKVYAGVLAERMREEMKDKKITTRELDRI